MTLANDLEQALGRFGLQEFRPGQRDVIESIVAGEDSMCVMPTGGGKSLCFQLPSVIRSGLTIVVSPLIALMKDQVDSLASRGIPAALINSTLSPSEQNIRLQDVAAGKYKLVYVAPERLRNSRFIEAIRATPIQLLAVDEAHCISQWGHDFRPDYTRIGQFRELLGGVQTVALTATATPRVREDICEVLGLQRPKQFMSGFARPNLHFGVVQAQNDREKDEQLSEFLRRAKGSGIIYSATRKRCDALVELISKKHKMSAGAYHAGLMADQRRSIQERFMNDDLKIIVATNAFGMGIDKSNLRFVIHYNMPGSLEAYYQEAGRAGRDGKQSQCVMLYSFQDRHIQEFFIDNNYPERATIKQVYEFLLSRDEDPIELTLEEIRDSLGMTGSPEVVGSCLQILARTGVLQRLEMGGGLAVLRIDSNLPTLVDLVPREAKVRRQVMRLIERVVGDRRGESVFVHPRWLLQESGMQRDALMRAIRELAKLDEFDYVPPFRGRAVHFRRRDLSFDQLEIDFENLKKRKDAEYDRLNQVVRYAQAPVCRQTSILNYFGDTNSDDCGRCDRCRRSPGWPKLELVDEKPERKRKENPATASNDASPEESLSKKSAAAAPVLSRGGLVMLEQIVESVQRLHGRLGKHLLSQYLCGSQNAKVQKLNLHRLSGFGLLSGLRQTDGVGIIDSLLAAGLLRQKEVNRNRPTIEVAPEWMNVAGRADLLGMVVVPPKLLPKLEKIAAKSGAHITATPANAAGAPRQSSRSDLDSPTRPQGRDTEAPNQAAAKREPSIAGEPYDGRREAKNGTPADASQNHIHRPERISRPDRQSLPRPTPDWKWTLLLFSREHSWDEVLQIRQMDDEELSTSLCDALRAGLKVSRGWIKSDGDAELTVGQRRVVRELQRRSAAGVG